MQEESDPSSQAKEEAGDYFSEAPWTKQPTPSVVGVQLGQVPSSGAFCSEYFGHLRRIYNTRAYFAAVRVITHGRRTKPYPGNGNSILFFNKNVGFSQQVLASRKRPKQLNEVIC